MTGGSGTDFDDVKVKGVDSGGNDREIGAVQDPLDNLWALKSTADVTIVGGVIPVVPAAKVIYQNGYLANGSIVNLNVDGSTTPVQYTYSAPSGKIQYIDFMSALLYDSGNNSFDTFGAEPKLTNGVKFEIQTDGTVYTLGYLFDNKDFLLTFAGTFGAQGNGGFAPDDSFWGSFKFRVPITLDGDQGDYIKATVQDDLTGVNNLHFVVNNWEILT